MADKKLNVGLLGCGRLGQVYARDLAGVIPETRLTAVADSHLGSARRCAETFEVAGCYGDPLQLLDDPKVDAVAIVTPTSTHAELVEACASRGKAVFCEKPLSIALDQALAMQETVEKSGIFFQMGFMRRFDPGYAAAKHKIEAGEIGRPVLFKSSSRDPYRPSVEYADPRHSGGMIVDMGIHDFDLALWLMGPVRRVQSTGGVLVYPELGEVGDIDNAIVTLEFEQGLGVIDLSRKGVYAYDIFTEVLGSEGAVRVGYLRETPMLLLKENQVSHDTVPYFPQRFRDAYTLQLQNFARNVLTDTPPPVTIADGVQALKVALAATKSLHQGRRVALD
ncbi:MAG TPA: Gfo/Idh/MocA family oxidoreductase [Acidobacteriota bacterium]|nr:Gfo/Idh/MocA family oxidoreductase [Acidobacteriota bacterium]